MLRFHLIGDYPPGSISCTWTPSTFHPDPSTQQLIDLTWSRAKERLGDRLFDGPMCRLESFNHSASSLHLLLSPISYKPFLGTNLHNAHLADRLGPSALANPVGASCALVAADGPLLMGRRNASVAYYPNRIHPFAGALEPHDPMDVFSEIRRELDEELALAPSHLFEIRCLGLAEDLSLRQPELIFLARSALTHQEISTRLDPQEHHSICSIDPTPSAVQATLQQTDLLTPIATATLLLFARHTLDPASFPLPD